MRIWLMAAAAVAGLHPAMTLAQDGASSVVGGQSLQGSPADGAKSSADVTPAAQSTPPPGLEDIIVTAQRRVETAQRAAVAIDVVGGAQLLGAGVTQVATLSSQVPSLTVQQIGGSTSFFIRGVGNFSVSTTSDPAAAFNYDGVYVARLTALSAAFFDLDRVEVLKGPQGTLYGRNATAGVINVLPTQPKLGELLGYGSVSYGNYNAVVAEGAINLPLGPKGALRVSGIVNQHDGYLSNGISDEDTQGLRVQMKVEATPDLTIRVSGDYTHQGGKGPGFSYLERQTLNFFTGKFTVTPTNIPRSESFLSPASQAFFTSLGAGPIGNVRATRDPFPDLFRNNDIFGANAQIDYRTDIGTLTVIPAVRFDTIRNLQPAGGFPIADLQKDIQYSIETRLAGSRGPIDYQLGFFYFDEQVRLTATTTTFGSSDSFSSAPTRYDTQSYAPFGRLTAHVASGLRLVAGVRYTHDAKQLNADNFSISAGCAIPFTCANTVLPPTMLYPGQLGFAIPVGPGTIPGPTPGSTVTRSTDVLFNQRLSASRFTYRGAVEYDVAPASLLYASVESGFRSGGFNTSVGFETFQPEFITAYTIGSKNRFFSNRVQLNLEAFYWDYTNEQVAHPGFDLSLPPRANSIVENVGRSEIKGVEAEGRVLVTPTTTLSADVQYLDAKNKFFTYQVPFALQSLTGCNVGPAATPGLLSVNCAGLPSFNSPKWTLNLGAEQKIALGDFQVVLSADTQYKTSRYEGFEYQPGQLQPASWTTNAQVVFGPSSNRWSLGAFIRNIENDRLLAVPFAFGGVLVGYTTPPRTYGVRGSVKF